MEYFLLPKNFSQTGKEQVKLLFSSLALGEGGKLGGRTHEHLIQGVERTKEFLQQL